MKEKNIFSGHRVVEPIIKVGETREDTSGELYEVLKISNTYEEVREYDSTGACQEFDTEEKIIEFGFDVDDVLFCAVHGSDFDTYVFLIERDSTILGE